MNIGIRPSSNSLNMKRVVGLETSVCFQSYLPKRSDDKNAVAIVKSVSQLGCVSQDSDALVSQGRKSQGNPMQKLLEPIQRVRFTKSTPRQASIREKKGPSMGKINVKVPHQRSPNAMKFEDRSFENTQRQQRCARSKAWNLARRNGYSRLRQQKSRRKESLWWIPERVCIWSVSKTVTLLSWWRP